MSETMLVILFVAAVSLTFGIGVPVFWAQSKRRNYYRDELDAVKQDRYNSEMEDYCREDAYLTALMYQEWVDENERKL